MSRILCLWFPNWPIQRTVHDRPGLEGRAVVLVANGGPQGKWKDGVGQVSNGNQAVVACCHKAISHGVRPGMPLVEAQSLVRGLGVVAYEPKADHESLVKWAEACERFSPRVAVEEGVEPESLFLDISNLGHLGKSEGQLVGQVSRFFTSRGYLVWSGVGETVGAAWAAAHFGGGKDCEKQNTKCKMQIAKPLDSTFEFANSALPVQSLRIGDETAATLRELGIETVGQLVALPREELAVRFGEELLRRLDQWAGTGREVIEPRRARAALEASYELEEPTGDRGVLVHVLKQLLDELSRQLTVRDQGAVLLACSLYLASVSPLLLRVGLLQPSANARQLLELIELQLEALQLEAEVERVELRVVVAGRLAERQGELFANRRPTDLHQLAVLVNRLSSRLGADCVLRAESRASPIPERAVRFMPAVAKSRGGQRAPRRESRAAIPLLLYSQPRLLDVVCVASGGSPQVVWFAGRREAIVACVGPERLETLWWRGPSVQRDYYRVTTEGGMHLWMFRRLQDGRWFLHGIFT